MPHYHCQGGDTGGQSSVPGPAHTGRRGRAAFQEQALGPVSFSEFCSSLGLTPPYPELSDSLLLMASSPDLRPGIISLRAWQDLTHNRPVFQSSPFVSAGLGDGGRETGKISTG